MSSEWNSPEQEKVQPAVPDLNMVADGVVDLPEDVYARILQQVQEIHSTMGDISVDDIVSRLSETSSEPSTESDAIEASGLDASPVPQEPQHLTELGLSLHQLSDLALKLLYLTGISSDEQLSQQLKLPVSLTAEVTLPLQMDRHVERLDAAENPLEAVYFQLTETGRALARDAFARCRYVGPAPVSLTDYIRQTHAQSISRFRISADQLQAGFSALVLNPDLLKRLGPAICSGQSILLSGPSGCGKSSIARILSRLVSEHGGTIFIPYAISIENQIISVFDPSCHHPVADEADLNDQSAQADLRWRQVRRPAIHLGADFQTEQLKLKFHTASGYYSAPVQVKANGGILVIDEIERQHQSPSRILDAWTQPLETRADCFQLSTGKSVSLPVDQLTVFATRLGDQKISDSAIWRRIRHKIGISAPTEQEFKEIFRLCCENRQIRYDDWIVSRLLTARFQANCPPTASDPQLLLDVVEAICRFRGERLHLSEKNLFEAFQECIEGSRVAA